MPNIEQKIKALNPNDFQSKLIYDNMEIIQGSGRYATFECIKCTTQYSNNIVTERLKKKGWCRQCSHSQKYPDYNIKQKILGYIQKHGSKSTSKVGFFGVSTQQYGTSFIAYISINGKKKRIGSYKSKEVAAYHYDKYCIDNYYDRKLNYPYWEKEDI